MVVKRASRSGVRANFSRNQRSASVIGLGSTATGKGYGSLRPLFLRDPSHPAGPVGSALLGLRPGTPETVQKEVRAQAEQSRDYRDPEHDEDASRHVVAPTRVPTRLCGLDGAPRGRELAQGESGRPGEVG